MNVLPVGGGGGGAGVGSGCACAIEGSVSATAVAPVTAAIISDFERPLRGSRNASRSSMGKKIPCYRRDASASCSKCA